MRDTIQLKGAVIEDFCNYKEPSMFLITCYCDFKCCDEAGCDHTMCQNGGVAQLITREYPYEAIYNAYGNNPITKAVVVGGMEPILQIDELVGLIKYFRGNGDNSPFIIYTGYNKDEIQLQLDMLKSCGNIIMKYGRYIPYGDEKFDELLGVKLASSNQYAEVLA